ncbi:hypothetical protein ACLMJK_004041 [Lecanora helva]
MSSDSDLIDLSSELSSVRSSPSPPPSFSYPSPQSSQDISASLSDSQQEFRKRSLTIHDDLPPPKKRRRVEAQPRTTAYLDLRSPPAQPVVDQTAQLDLLLKTLRKKRKIVVVAGAGISTSAGVPDFRSSNGLFNTLKNENKLKASGKHLFDASVYQTDDSTTSFHDMVRTLSKLVSDAKPTAFHEMLATIASEGRLMRLYTQNVDGIDTSLPPLATTVPLDRRGPWPKTIQLHGSLEKMVCSKCNTLKDFEPALFNGPIPPLCAVCEDMDKIRTENAGKRSHGIGRLRPRMVLYNELHPDEEAIGMVSKADIRTRPDAIIVVGTSMEIPGVKRIVREMCKTVRDRKNGVAIWINRGPPPTAKEFEDCWDLVIAGDCDKVAQRANMRRWNDEGTDYKQCTESEAEIAKRQNDQVKVVVNEARSKSSTPPINATPEKIKNPALMMTPAESPKSKATQFSHLPIKFPPLDKKAKPGIKGTGKTSMKKTASKIPKPGSKNPNGLKLSKQNISTNIKGIFKITKNSSASVLAPAKPVSILAPSTPKKSNPETTAKIVKAQHPSPTGPEKARKLLESINEPIPMAPLSPNSIKSNGPLTPPDFEDLPLKIQRVEIPLPHGITSEAESPDQGKRLKRMSEEIVSPSGTTPTGMGHILHA